MTIVNCPQGCGGHVNTAKTNFCTNCRRDLAAVEVVIAEDKPEFTYSSGIDPMTQRKLSWCWEWFGPANHRMRCRQPKGHTEGQHNTHETIPLNSIIVSTEGHLVSGGGKEGD